MNNHGMLTLQLLFMNDQSTVLWLDFSIHECCILLVLHEKCFSCQCCLIHQSDPVWRRCSWITWGLFIGSKSLYWNYCAWQKKTVFTRSAITLQKVNRFGWNLEHCEDIVVGWPWQIWGAIRAVATVGEAAEILFFYQHLCSFAFWPCRLKPGTV